MKARKLSKPVIMMMIFQAVFTLFCVLVHDTGIGKANEIINWLGRIDGIIVTCVIVLIAVIAEIKAFHVTAWALLLVSGAGAVIIQIISNMTRSGRIRAYLAAVERGEIGTGTEFGAYKAWAYLSLGLKYYVDFLIVSLVLGIIIDLTVRFSAGRRSVREDNEGQENGSLRSVAESGSEQDYS